MADPPRKRQRLSPDTYQSVGDSIDDGITQSQNPTTPTRRASYLSPTKASLSRSHPNILAKSPKRGSLTEPRGKLLRQELLGSKTATDTSLSTPKTAPRPTRATRNASTELAHGGGGDKDGFAEAIAQSFAAPAPTQSKADHAHGSGRSPLRTREPPNTVSSSRDTGQKLRSTVLDDLPVPKLVTRPEVPARQRSEARNEPELPPTPVQLGLGTVPERPRGLASSSSIGSKSGSGKHRRRVRNGQSGAITSSPLKPKATRPISPTDFSDLEEVENDFAEEAAESDVESGQDHTKERVDTETETREGPEPDGLPLELREKQAQGASLRFELQQLRNDLARLESMAKLLQHDTNPEMDESLIQLLELKEPKQSISLQAPETHPSFISNPSAYLGLFTPSGLDLQHETSTIQVLGRPKVLHRLKMTSTVPRLQNTLKLSVDVQVDAEDARIDLLAVTNPKSRWESTSLDQWINKRLATPLHKFDVGGIVHGTSHYLEACITRAKALKNLDKRYNKGLDDGPAELSNKKQTLTNMQALELSLYLHDTQLLIIPPGGQSSEKNKAAQSGPNEKQVLLTYEIDLTWTGDVVNRVDICVTGVSAKGQQGAKELFVKLLATQGVVKAFDAVWGVLGWHAQSKSVDVPDKRPGRPRKAIAS